jgi:putative PIN family toxin of toxin-antitoxin system
MARSSVPKLGPAQRKKWLQTLRQHAASPESGSNSSRYWVVLDTNVWVSGLQYGGNAGVVIRLVLSHHELVCSDYIVDELIERLKLVRPKVPQRWLRMMRLQLEGYCVPFATTEQSEIRDPKDEPVVALAKATEAMVVTGDKDFLEHEGDLGVDVVTIAEAVQLLG